MVKLCKENGLFILLRLETCIASFVDYLGGLRVLFLTPVFVIENMCISP